MKLYEQDFPEFGVVRLEQWPEGIILWVGGEIAWKSWEKDDGPTLHRIFAIATGSPQISPDEAKARWGDKIYYRRGPVTAWANIDDDGTIWEPTFDGFANWTGYRKVIARSV